jgi:hypothetical protein
MNINLNINNKNQGSKIGTMCAGRVLVREEGEDRRLR